VATPLVDDLPQPGAQPSRWLGLVVPKRHARRSVTRTLLKRQIRSALAESESLLPVGLWVVRLRAPFERAAFPSAASDALRDAARLELAALVSRSAAGR
jgi:ribonuclease P protein component